jgi:hypothetical protein
MIDDRAEKIRASQHLQKKKYLNTLYSTMVGFWFLLVLEKYENQTSNLNLNLKCDKVQSRFQIIH